MAITPSTNYDYQPTNKICFEIRTFGGYADKKWQIYIRIDVVQIFCWCHNVFPRLHIRVLSYQTCGHLSVHNLQFTVSWLAPLVASQYSPLCGMCVVVKPLYDIDESISLRINFDYWMTVVCVTQGSEMAKVHQVSSVECSILNYWNIYHIL